VLLAINLLSIPVKWIEEPIGAHVAVSRKLQFPSRGSHKKRRAPLADG
jgi:hypothetical protein